MAPGGSRPETRSIEEGEGEKPLGQDLTTGIT